jgi:hypothetical protein
MRGGRVNSRILPSPDESDSQIEASIPQQPRVAGVGRISIEQAKIGGTHRDELGVRPCGLADFIAIDRQNVLRIRRDDILDQRTLARSSGSRHNDESVCERLRSDREETMRRRYAPGTSRSHCSRSDLASALSFSIPVAVVTAFDPSPSLSPVPPSVINATRNSIRSNLDSPSQRLFLEPPVHSPPLCIPAPINLLPNEELPDRIEDCPTDDSQESDDDG